MAFVGYELVGYTGRRGYEHGEVVKMARMEAEHGPGRLGAW
jgi:hypothetical protein